MWKWRSRRVSGVEPLLKRLQPRPVDAFVEALAQRVLADGPRPAGRVWSRVAFACAISTFVLGTFGSFGGLSYAASGAAGTYRAAKQVAVHHELFVSVHKSSAAAQYRKPPKPPGRVGGGQAGVQSAVARPRGTLPFTGVSLLATLLVSLALIATGVALRRRERRNS